MTICVRQDYICIKPAWDNFILRACICMLGAFRAAHQWTPVFRTLPSLYQTSKDVRPLSSRELDSATDWLTPQVRRHIFFFSLIPGARHVSRRGNSTGTKPQRSTALAGIWHLSFGAIRKVNAKCISGLDRTRYLKSRRAFLGKFFMGRRFCPVCEI